MTEPSKPIMAPFDSSPSALLPSNFGSFLASSSPQASSHLVPGNLICSAIGCRCVWSEGCSNRFWQRLCNSGCHTKSRLVTPPVQPHKLTCPRLWTLIVPPWADPRKCIRLWICTRPDSIGQQSPTQCPVCTRTLRCSATKVSQLGSGWFGNWLLLGKNHPQSAQSRLRSLDRRQIFSFAFIGM